MAVALNSWKALGTSVHVLATDDDGLGRATTAVHDVLEDVDAVYSRFREDSELSRLNASAGRAVRVSPLLATAIDAAQRAARLTNGAVDPTIGHAIRVAGYDDDFPRIAADRGPVTLRAWRVPGWQAIRFDRPSRTVLLPPGVELDLGSTGKALAADLAATAALAAAGAGGVLVSLGGDIATAGEPPAGGWRILVAEDSQAKPDGDGEVICVPAGGVATSSTTVRRWSRGGAILHHIIDPETGLPATGPFRTVTVAAATCLDANIASTAAIVRGESAIDWLMTCRLPARLVENDGTIHYIGPWPDPAGVAA
ncbi:MAG: FAD:protein FMN transferase [Candidatus Dormibacteraeota bacterium]|nr:FAD:protein FMN transferase [Candidatus Dormibacteraeota bacterium]MDQ6884329.1 FAD:protein FMN transferase [Candidatus Dormibacteraeota bacterium]